MSNEKLVLKQKRARGEDGYKTFSIRIREDIKDRIEIVASESGYTKNELIGVLLEYALDNYTVEKSNK